MKDKNGFKYIKMYGPVSQHFYIRLQCHDVIPNNSWGITQLFSNSDMSIYRIGNTSASINIMPDFQRYFIVHP